MSNRPLVTKIATGLVHVTGPAFIWANHTNPKLLKFIPPPPPPPPGLRPPKDGAIMIPVKTAVVSFQLVKNTTTGKFDYWVGGIARSKDGAVNKVFHDVLGSRIGNRVPPPKR